MKQNLILGLVLFIAFTSCFTEQHHHLSTQVSTVGSEYYGNLTQQQKQSIRDAITVISYKTSDVGNISQYIGDTLDKLWGSSWQTFVYGNKCTQSQLSSTTMFNNRWAVFNTYTDLKYCYYVYQQHKCRAISINSPKNAPGQDWGQSFKPADRAAIKGWILQAAARSNVMSDNTEYLKNKLGSGYWSVAIADPQDGPFGFYACIFKDFWGLIWEFGPFGWAYIILRYN